MRKHPDFLGFDDIKASEELKQRLQKITSEVMQQKQLGALPKEQGKMSYRKKRIFAIVAASIMAVLSVTTVYASEISRFIQSLMNKTGVYSTVVDGSTLYLESPLMLGEGTTLQTAMFTDEGLNLRITADSESYPDVRIRVDGEEFSPTLFMGETLSFHDVNVTEHFEIIIDGVSHPVSLAISKPIVGNGEIAEAESGNVDWISIGYKKVDKGIQLLTTFDKENVRMVHLELPLSDRVEQNYLLNGKDDFQNTSCEELQPLIGQNKNEGSFEFHALPDETGNPLTIFTTESSNDQEITLHVPGIVVTNEKKTSFSVVLPEVGQKIDNVQTIDLGLQSMLLESIERTSESTAFLKFKLNTGTDKDVRVWSAEVTGVNSSGKLLWENGVCTMDITFNSTATELEITIDAPTFIVDGDWTLLIQ